MLSFKPVEELPRRPGLSFSRVLQALPDSLSRVSTGGDIEQALIGLRVLDDRRRLAFHGEHDRTLALLEMFHEVARPPAKSGERMNVFRDVKHRTGSPSTFLDAIQIVRPQCGDE